MNSASNHGTQNPNDVVGEQNVFEIYSIQDLLGATGSKVLLTKLMLWRQFKASRVLFKAILSSQKC